MNQQRLRQEISLLKKQIFSNAEQNQIYSQKPLGKFLEKIEIQREIERQRFGGEVAFLGVVFIYVASLELGVIDMISKTFTSTSG